MRDNIPVEIFLIEINVGIAAVLLKTVPYEAYFNIEELTFHNIMNSQLDPTVTHFIDNYNQLNIFTRSPFVILLSLRAQFGR